MCDEATEEAEFKASSNAQTHGRKQTRSKSPSPSLSTERSEVRFWSQGVPGSRSGMRQQGERGWNSPLTEQQYYSDCGEQRFEAPRHFNNMGPALGLGPASAPMGFQQQPSHFNGPSRFNGPGYVEGLGHPGPHYGIPHQGGPLHFQNFPGQQSHLRFNQQHSLQPSMMPMGPPIYINPMAPQQNFPMASHYFPQPMNPQFPTPSLAFPGQQNIQQVGIFNIPQNFSQPGPAPFYNPAAPTVGLQQPEWIYSGGIDLEDHSKSQFFKKENEEREVVAKEKEFQITRATKDQVEECCEICHESFDTYWVEEEEDWFLKNAIKVDGKNFHPLCFQDHEKNM